MGLSCCFIGDKERFWPIFDKIVEIFFEKKAKKIWWVSKLAIPLHRFSPQTGRESNSKKSSLTCLQHY